MRSLAGLETILEDLFVRKAPRLSENGKKGFVRFAPVAALILGTLTLASFGTLWHWAHVVNNYASLLSQLCSASGTYSGCASTVGSSRLTVWIWLSLLVLFIEAILYLAAYGGLRDHKKQGWNYIYYGALVNFLYIIVTVFSGYNGSGSFLGNLIGSLVGFYVIFQIRDYYVGKKTVVSRKTMSKPFSKD